MIQCPVWQNHRRLIVCSVGLILILSACEKRRYCISPVEVPPTDREAVTTSASPWNMLESMAPGYWRGIDSAADVAWKQETRTLEIGIGYDLNGVRWSGALPKTPYVLELEARRITGSDFFCGLTFPVRDGSQQVSLIVGGWGGNLVGISSINGMDASENSTATAQEFEDQRWYRIRVQVEEEHLQAWIDDKQVVDAYTEEQRLSLRPGPIEECAPLGLATYVTKAEFRNIRWKPLDP